MAFDVRMQVVTIRFGADYSITPRTKKAPAGLPTGLFWEIRVIGFFLIGWSKRKNVVDRVNDRV